MAQIPNIDRGTEKPVETKRKNSFNLIFDDLPIEFICNPSKWKEDQKNNPIKKRKSKNENSNDNYNNTGIV